MTACAASFHRPQLDVPLLHHVTLIDTPGILAGKKQSTERNYSFEAVVQWRAWPALRAMPRVRRPCVLASPAGSRRAWT